MSICPIALPKNTQQKKIFFGNFFGPLLLLNEFRADSCTWEKRGVMTNRGGEVLQSCFLPCTPSVLCCGSKTSKTTTTSSSSINNNYNSNNSNSKISHNRGGQFM